MALNGNIVKILDPVSLEEVAEGAEGEICCAGDNVMEGYYKNDKVRCYPCYDTIIFVFLNFMFTTVILGGC